MQASFWSQLVVRSVFAILSFHTASLLSAADWPQYRGPNQDGVSPEVLRTNWTAQPPQQLWKVPLDAGLSSLTIQNGRVFTMERHGDTITGREFCVALNAGTGAQLWETDVDLADYPDGGVWSGSGPNDDGPRSTPTADGDRVYALGSYLNLVCLNVTNGAVIWSRNLMSEYASGIVSWQSAGSPLVVGDLVYVAAATSVDRLFAFNKHTGALAWRKHNDTMTQASPVFATIAGVPQVIFFTQSGLVSVKPDTGDQLWRYLLPPDAFSTSTASSAVVAGNLVYCSAAYGVGAGVVGVTNNAGTLTATQVWRTQGSRQNHWATPIFHDGHFYGVYGHGSLSVQCIEAQSGTIKWQQAGVGYGSVLKVGRHLLVLEDDGWLSLVRLNPNSYQEIDRFRALTGKCWNNAAVSDGIVYVRSTLEAAAYALAAPRVELSATVGTITPQGFELTLVSDDEQPITVERAAGIAVYHTDNPAAPRANWSRLQQPFVTSGNGLKINDPGVTGAAQRFYRAEETP